MSRFWRGRSASRNDGTTSTSSSAEMRSAKTSTSGSVDLPRSGNTLSPKDSVKDLQGRIENIKPNELDQRLEKIHMLQKKRSMKDKSMLRSAPPPTTSDVLIVGAGPAGLLLASNLIRFGINAEIVDNRSMRTATGRADVLQPKTIETLRQMRLADPLLAKGVKVYDTRFWKSRGSELLKRVGREPLFPAASLDASDPYLLVSHQGLVEDLFLRDLMERGVDVMRGLTFVDCKIDQNLDRPIEVVCKSDSASRRNLATSYLVGCDGAHSNIRKAMGARPVGSSHDQIWGVIDGVLETDFPDIYSSTVIQSEESGSVVLQPRERGLTRLYIELKQEISEGKSKDELSQEFFMNVAKEVFEPYYMQWRQVVWFGKYQIGHKVASKFQDESDRVFIAGDAASTLSPHASQGMNKSLHDSWNLAWKLNLTIRGLAKPSLIKTYEEERRQVAEELIDVDYEQSSTFANGDTTSLVENFQRNMKFTSGYGADYAPNVLNSPQKGTVLGSLRAGSLPPPAKVTRHFDSNPVDIQLDIPMLGQFRLFFFAKSLQQTKEFLEIISAHALSSSSIMGKITNAANSSYSLQPPLAARSDDFTHPERYTTVSGIFTFALVLQSTSKNFELQDLPPLWRQSRYTVYHDDVPHLDTRQMSCTEKWLGTLSGTEVGIVVQRPDGYVSTVRRYVSRSKENGIKATKWLDEYFDGFLRSGF